MRPEKIQRKRGQKNEIHHQAESETGGAIRPAAEKGVLQVAGTTKKTAPKRSTTPAVLTGTVPEWANSTAIAQLLGKTTRRVQQLTQDGILETEVPPGGGARKYRTCETIQRYIAHVEQKAQEIGEGGRLAELNLKKLEAEVALKESQGSLHRLKTAIAEGKYLPAEQATEELAEFMAAFQKIAMTIPARMAGAMIPVMSNSGSGNQGISATLPVVVYADETAADEEHTIRALVLSHLTVIYIKQSLGRLSALCGCVVAATGSSCGITFLMGGAYEQVAAAVKNMIANLTGMICDGAKPSCSMKLTSGVSTAVLSAMMAMDGHCVTPVEGIIEEDVDKCIRNLTAIGRDGMNETDRLVLGIMTHK